MCDICKVQDENPEISTEALQRIIRAVEEHEQAHLEHTVVAILTTLGVKEVTVTAETAQRAAEQLEEEGLTLQEKVSADWSSMTYVITPENEGPQTPSDNGLSPLKPGEVSDENELAALFKALGLDF
jgi:hypothetical protein